MFVYFAFLSILSAGWLLHHRMHQASMLKATENVHSDGPSALTSDGTKSNRYTYKLDSINTRIKLNCAEHENINRRIKREIIVLKFLLHK